jgi:hypothetical protein
MMALKTDARAVAGTKAPTTRRSDMSDSALEAIRFLFCTENAEETPAGVDADFFLEISRLWLFVVAHSGKQKRLFAFRSFR